MFVKVTKSGPRRYVQLVEAYRDAQGRPKQRTLVTLGRLDQIDNALNSVHVGLSRILGVNTEATFDNGTAAFDSSRTFGDVWALDQIWKQLGLDRLRGVLQQRSRHRIDLESLLRIMVFNRLCDANSKLGVLRWLQCVSLPDMNLRSVDHHQLLRTMDALIEYQEVIGQVLAGVVSPLVNEDLSVIFYDITTIRAEGLTELVQDVRQFGMSKEGVIARQFMLGLVQTAQGIPIYHEVFEGNKAEGKTLKETLQRVMSRFPLKRVIVVADRGLLSINNLQELQEITLPGGQQLEFILAVPGRRYSEFAQLLEPINAVCEAHLSRIVRVDLKGEGFSYRVDDKALELARSMDGKLLLVSNAKDLSADEVIKRYKSLGDIERGFRVLKSEIEIGPVYHRLPERIRAHATICFIALVLHRVMRSRLQKKPLPEIVSPERALMSLRRIQTHSVTLPGQKTPITGISTISPEQSAIFQSIGVRKPTARDAYVNL